MPSSPGPTDNRRAAGALRHLRPPSPIPAGGMTFPTPPEVHAVHLRLGYASGNCEACHPPLPEPTHDSPLHESWHAAARAGRLRPAIVGGVPLDPHHDARLGARVSSARVQAPSRLPRQP